MTQKDDRIGGVLRDLGIALGIAFVIAYGYAAWQFHELNPVVGIVAMFSVVIVHGWLTSATWHGLPALLVLIALFYLIVRVIKNPSWPRIAVMVLWLLLWGTYAYHAPDLLGDGL